MDEIESGQWHEVLRREFAGELNLSVFVSLVASQRLARSLCS